MKRFVSYKLRPERLTRYHITMYEKSTDRTEGAVRRKTIALANFLAVSLLMMEITPIANKMSVLRDAWNKSGDVVV